MKFNIKFKYILFIILSFVFVMSDVGAATTVNIKELYPNSKNFQAKNTSDGAKYFTLWQNTDGTRKAISFFHGYTSRRDDGTYDLLCYDPCADPSTSYSAITDNSEFAQKLSYLMNKTSVSEKYALGVAQMLGAIYKKNHCDSISFNNSNLNKSGGKKFNDVIKEYAHYCSSQNFVDDASLRNNEYYLQFDGRGLSSAQLCQLYNDVNKNYTKYKAQYSIKKPVVSKPEVTEENGGKVSIYTVTVNINNSEAFINNFRSTFANLQSKARVVPTGGNSFGDSITSAASWYSINNSKYKFISADLNANRLEVKLSIKGECSPATITINDHGAVSSSGILQASSGGSQYLAVKSSLFVTSARISCSNDNQTSSSRCSVTNPPEHNTQTCTSIPVYRKIAKLPGAQKKYYIRDCTQSAQKVYTLSFDDLVASPFSIRSMGFSSVQDFTFSEIGADCCQDYVEDANFRSQLLNLDSNASSWQNAYNKWCNSNEQYCTYDPNTKSVYNAAIPIAYNGGNPLATAQYAFESLDCCEDYKNSTSGFGAVKTDLSWQNAYITYCGGTKKEVTTSTACINPAPNSQTKVDNKINNCCLDDTHSYVQEVQLNDLFDNTKTHEGVTYFEPLPTCEGSDLDVAKGQINNYCDYYCTERLDIEVPGSTSADSGRYFKFNEIDGHASPKVDGYRRCRVTIKYDQWYSEYKQKLNNLQEKLIITSKEKRKLERINIGKNQMN